jgi:hypothetical protein
MHNLPQLKLKIWHARWLKRQFTAGFGRPLPRNPTISTLGRQAGGHSAPIGWATVRRNAEPSSGLTTVSRSGSRSIIINVGRELWSRISVIAMASSSSSAPKTLESSFSPPLTCSIAQLGSSGIDHWLSCLFYEHALATAWVVLAKCRVRGACDGSRLFV